MMMEISSPHEIHFFEMLGVGFERSDSVYLDYVCVIVSFRYGNIKPPIENNIMGVTSCDDINYMW
jgi:hypothetical protein